MTGRDLDYGGYASGLERGNPLSSLMHDSMEEILTHKNNGACIVPQSPDEDTFAFLGRARERLARISGNFPSVEDSDGLRSKFGFAMGMAGGAGPLGARAFIAEQTLSLDPRFWADPIRAAVNAAAQVAIHRAMRAQVGKREDEINAHLVHEMLSFIGRDFVPAFVEAGATLPDGSRLDFASVSMQGTKGDHHDSDIAVVVGTRIANVPRYRVVLFQAKKSTGHRNADVSYRKGEQLDGILSTGMGFYLFYPEPTCDGTVPPTVKSAARVFSVARKQDPKISLVPVAGPHAWDFGTFVSSAMLSPVIGIGRVFPTEKAVADALLDQRMNPLKIVMISDHRECPIWTLVERSVEAGYVQEQRGSLQDAIEEALSRPGGPDAVSRR